MLHRNQSLGAKQQSVLFRRKVLVHGFVSFPRQETHLAESCLIFIEFDDELCEMWLAHNWRTGLCLAVALSVIVSAWVFDIFSTSCTDAKTQRWSWLDLCACCLWLHVRKCGVIELNKCVSCVILPAICSEVLSYLICILEPSFIRSNNLSNWHDEFLKDASWLDFCI